MHGASILSVFWEDSLKFCWKFSALVESNLDPHACIILAD